MQQVQEGRRKHRCTVSYGDSYLLSYLSVMCKLAKKRKGLQNGARSLALIVPLYGLVMLSLLWARTHAFLPLCCPPLSTAAFNQRAWADPSKTIFTYKGFNSPLLCVLDVLSLSRARGRRARGCRVHHTTAADAKAACGTKRRTVQVSMTYVTL